MPPRSAHSRSPASPGPANGLASQTSPYLLQHRHNPVAWQPWGPGALDEARRRGVPIFLSVGYSTCYWCHVMERESFEDEATASILNPRFVCIKVDREERPDIDDIHMAAVQLFNQGQGGWPMSVWLTPPGARGPADRGLEPIYAGTYFPREAAYGRPSLTMLAERISEAWAADRAGLLDQAESAAHAVREHLASRNPATRIDDRHLSAAIGALLRTHDDVHGGFGGAPKFPQPSYAMFLIEMLDSIDSAAFRSQAERAVKLTLDTMALGGLRDHVGGGFHRYATDATWTVPHFEKMLYDNAQLVSLYAKAFERFGDAFHAAVVRDTLAYIDREMTTGDGLFASAQDAEVDAREGLNYLWLPEEFDEVLGGDAALARRVYGLDSGANFQDPHHPGEPPRNVLVLRDRPSKLAAAEGLAPDQFERALASINARLLAARAERDQPGLDDKVICSWNGLMIAAMADAAAALQDRGLVDRAARAADVLHATLRGPTGTLQRSARGGRTSGDAVLEDYAMLAAADFALHRASARLGRDPAAHLERAALTMREARAAFGDGRGGYFDTRADQPDLLVRTRNTYDGAIPSATSVMLNNHIDLLLATGEAEHRDQAEAMLASVSAAVAESPVGAINSTRGLARLMAIDPSILDRLGPGESELPASSGAPVRILAQVNRVEVPEQSPAKTTLRIVIAEGFHIAAHDPGVPGLQGFAVRIEGGAGVEARPEYPAGTASATHPGVKGEAAPRIYDRTFDLGVMLTRSGPWTGRPLLVATYQACTESECLAPARVELDIALDPVK